MSAGYIDPKPSGDWAEEELFRSTQANRIRRDLNHFALAPFLSWNQGTINNANVGGQIASFRFLNTDTQEMLFATPENSATLVKASGIGSPPTLNDSSHGQSASDINNITALASHASSRMWFGLDKDATSSVGYLSRVPAGTWSRVNRAAGASTGAAAVTAMAYSPLLALTVASWNDQDIEHNSSGTTWVSAGNPGNYFGELLWGETEFVGAIGGFTDEDTIYTSVDGDSWANVNVGVELPGTTRIAHDYSDDTWYALGSDIALELVIVTSQSPGTSWAQIPGVNVPGVATGGITSFVVAGGIMALMTAQGLLMVSPDLGQTWVAMGQFGTDAVIRKAGGRLFILAGSAVFVSGAHFPPYTFI